MNPLRCGVARRAAQYAPPRVTRRWCAAAAAAASDAAAPPQGEEYEHPLRKYMNGDYQVWNTKGDESEPKELPIAEALSHVLLKVRLVKRLIGSCTEDDERARLHALQKDLNRRTRQWTFNKSRLVPDEKNAETDKAALNVVIRYALRFGSLTQMTYEWILADLITVYGVQALDGTFLVKLLARCGLFDVEENLVLTANQKSLQPPEWVHQLSFDPDEIEDDCADIREEFTTRSYAIDDPSTFEVDDAMAIDDEGWITVHVADVSRYLPYTSDLRVAAQNLATTVYFPDQVLTMLPRALVDVATLKAAPNESLTCSVAFKMNDAGEVLDRKLLVTRTHNCVRITYEQVNAALKAMGEADYADAPDVEMPVWYEEAVDGKALQKMHRLAKILREKRTDRGALMIVRPEWYPKLSTASSDDVSHDERTKVNTETAAYSIDVRCRKNTGFDSRKIVEEFMLLSGNSVATVCEEENIPCPYRVTPNDVVQGESYELLDNVVRVPPPEACHSIEGQYERGTQLLNGQKAAFYSSLNIGHIALNANYCHFTSPLRRYPDLLVHYHVKDHLKRLHSKSYVEQFSEEDRDNMTSVLKRALPAVCQRVSNTTNSKKKMMRGMTETWLIRDLERKIVADPDRLFEGYVGATHWVAASPEHSPLRGGFEYCSTVVLCDYGLLVRVYHDGSYAEGERVWCAVRESEAQTRYLKVAFVRKKEPAADAAVEEVRDGGEGVGEGAAGAAAAATTPTTPDDTTVGTAAAAATSAAAFAAAAKLATQNHSKKPAQTTPKVAASAKSAKATQKMESKAKANAKKAAKAKDKKAAPTPAPKAETAKAKADDKNGEAAKKGDFKKDLTTKKGEDALKAAAGRKTEANTDGKAKTKKKSAAPKEAKTKVAPSKGAAGKKGEKAKKSK